MSNRKTLEFPAAVTYTGKRSDLPRRTVMVGGESFRDVVVAAGRLTEGPPAAAWYMLDDEEAPAYYLKVWTEDVSIRVGPMAGPSRPESLSPSHGYPLADFLNLIELHTEHPYSLPMTVIRDGDRSRPAVRRANETEEAFAERAARHETWMREFAQAEGVFPLSYPVAAEYWRARDLRAVLALAWQVLEQVYAAKGMARGDVNGGLRRSDFQRRGGRVVNRWLIYLSFWSGAEYMKATIWLPVFPAAALAEWLEASPASINVNLTETDLRMLLASGEAAEATKVAARRAGRIKRATAAVGGA